MPAIQSMTGFGAARCEIFGGTLSFEIRSVNGRGSDVRLHVPDALTAITNVLEDALKGRLGRGRHDVRLLFDGTAPNQGVIDPAVATSAYEQFVALRDALMPGQSVPFDALLRVPGIFKSKTTALSTEQQSLINGTLLKATEELTRDRSREGAKLEQEIRALQLTALDLVNACATANDQSEGSRIGRLREIFHEAGLSDDAQRKLVEFPEFSRLGDAHEEVARLRIHLDEIGSVLAKGGECGRRLDFIAQELLREASTLSAKSTASSNTIRLTDLKVAIDRIREQSANIA